MTAATTTAAPRWLESSWRVRELRHPILRLLGCVTHFLVTFFLCSSSPLAASRQSPAHFPVYSRWLLVAFTRPAWGKSALLLALAALLVVLLRLAAFRVLLQKQWNWQRVTQLRTRAPALERDTETLVELADARLSPSGGANGSWTFVVCTFPFAWAAAAALLERAVQGSGLERTLFDADDTVSQMRAQALASQALLALSALKLLMTTDLLLQDTHYSRAMFGNWLVRVRRAYITYAAVRLTLCWLLLAALGVGGVYFQGLWRLQQAWVAFSLGTTRWLSNEAWNALLGGAAVALDVLWLVQDFAFPGLATPVGVRIFALPVETLSLRLAPGSGRALTSVTAKWAASFVVLGLLLPLETCHFAQHFAYTPTHYAQYVDATTYRVLPLSAPDASESVTATQPRLLRDGALSRYFGWSAWERAPALGLVLLSLGFATWLWRAERYTVRSERQSGSQQRVGLATLSADTALALSKQQQLRRLYARRASSDDACFALAALSVGCVVLQFRSIWRSERAADGAKHASLHPLEHPGEAYGVLLFLLTAALVRQLCRRYALKRRLLELRNALPASRGSGLPRQLLAPFLAELLLCALCLPPFVHGRVDLQETRFVVARASLLPGAASPACPAQLTPSPATSDEPACELGYSYPLEIVNMLVLARLYWCARLPRNRLLRRVVRGGEHVPLDSLRWSFRVAFALAPKRLLFALFACLWAGTAAAVSIFERPFPSLLGSEQHSLWLTIVTMSTVGYGDAFPVTALGRLATFLGAVVGGAVLLSLMTSVFLESMKGSRAESHVLASMERVRWQKRLWHTSAVLLASAWRWRRTRRGGAAGGSASARRAAERQLFAAAHQFKLLRKRRPKETHESLEALQVGAVAHWRAHELEHWVARARAETQASLAALERDLAALETAMGSVVAA
ncbi:hypothetical protein PybrP1_008971 [[Pythium] brassicae (nom. inval.)]|nr:hypothetical protein PybrP1_008971 [[Pythium] brassicae (nom. inval.)]